MAIRCDRTAGIGAAALLLAACAPASAQLRIGTWNVTFYTSDFPSARDAAFKTALYGEYQGRAFAPDVLLGQEFLDQKSVTAFLALLNEAPGSPGDWGAAPYVTQGESDNAFFYRKSKVSFIGVTTIALGGGPPNHPRNVERYDFRPKGYIAASTVLAAYGSHMKSGETQEDKERRLLEAQHIRTDAEGLNPAWNFLLGGDFNIQSADQAAYQELVGDKANNDGRLVDPIKSPGNWNNNAAFRFVHTQDPASQMDDRFDQLLLEVSLLDDTGLGYIGNPALAYSVSTWNDPNHSYRVWGNDGTSYNQTLRVAGNTMVGAAIAQALIDAADGNGHIPVFLDLRVPAEIAAPGVVDFGTVVVGASAEADLAVENAGDVGLWTAAGIANLNYSLSVSGGFTGPGGPFVDGPGGGGNLHTLTMDTSSPGQKSGKVTIASDAPDEPSRIVFLKGTVIACYADCDGSGALDIDDFVCFQTLFGVGDEGADCDGSGGLDVDDFVCFQTAFAVGCP